MFECVDRLVKYVFNMSPLHFRLGTVTVFANGAALKMLCFNEGLFKWIKFSKGSVSLKVEV